MMFTAQCVHKQEYGNVWGQGLVRFRVRANVRFRGIARVKFRVYGRVKPYFFMMNHQ